MAYSKAERIAYAKKKSKEHGGKIEGWIDELITATDTAKQSDLIQSYLTTASKFHNTQVNNALEIALRKWMKSRNIPIDYQEKFYAYGATNGSKIMIDSMTGTHIILHEIAHVLIHFDKAGKHTPEYKAKGPRKVESEAEATAHIVAKHFGIDNLEIHQATLRLLGPLKKPGRVYQS